MLNSNRLGLLNCNNFRFSLGGLILFWSIFFLSDDLLFLNWSLGHNWLSVLFLNWSLGHNWLSVLFLYWGLSDNWLSALFGNTNRGLLYSSGLFNWLDFLLDLSRGWKDGCCLGFLILLTLGLLVNSRRCKQPGVGQVGVDLGKLNF